MTRRTSILLVPFLLAGACQEPATVGGPCDAPGRNFGTGPNPCRQQFYFPTGVATDPRGGDIRVQTLPTTEQIYPVVSPGCADGGTFTPPDGGVTDGGEPAGYCHATPAATRRLWLPVRGDPSVTFVDVRLADTPTLPCAGS